MRVSRDFFGKVALASPARGEDEYETCGQEDVLVTESTRIDLELDCRGLTCPLPMVEINRHITRLAIGGVLRAVASDPSTFADIPAWTTATGNRLVSATETDEGFVYVIERRR